MLINSIGGSAWGRNGRVARPLAERPLWDWGLHFPRDVLPVRQITRVVPVLAEDAITNVVRNPRAVWQVANLARKASLTHELEVLKHRRMPIVILWGRGDRIVPEEAFRELCSAAGVGSAAAQAVTVEGSHSWLLSDPAGFGEVMTNIVAVAERAAELDEQSA